MTLPRSNYKGARDVAHLLHVCDGASLGSAPW
jgi:hypothetical protein